MTSIKHKTKKTSLEGLKHITHPRAAWAIVLSGRFESPHNPGSYDGGMNFLGVLGQYSNTQPAGKGATLTCRWSGQVSQPLPYDAYGTHDPDVMYDFNGSGTHHRNNDPRYFLPYGSKGLFVTKVDFDSEDDLLFGWCYAHGGCRAWLFEKGLFRGLLCRAAHAHVVRLNDECRNGKVQLTVQYRPG